MNLKTGFFSSLLSPPLVVSFFWLFAYKKKHKTTKEKNGTSRWTSSLTEVQEKKDTSPPDRKIVRKEGGLLQGILFYSKEGHIQRPVLLPLVVYFLWFVLKLHINKHHSKTYQNYKIHKTFKNTRRLHFWKDEKKKESVSLDRLLWGHRNKNKGTWE